MVAVEVREHEDGRAVVAEAHDGERVAVAARDEAFAHAGAERGMRGEDAVEAGDEVHHVVGRIPVEVAAVVHVDLLGGVPLHAVRDAPGALVAEQRGELHAQAGVGLSALREAVVVVRLGEVHERAVLLRARDRAGQVPLERAAVVGLENLGVGPVEVGAREQRVRDLELAAEALEHEHGVGVLSPRGSCSPRRSGSRPRRTGTRRGTRRPCRRAARPSRSRAPRGRPTSHPTRRAR